MTELPVIFRHNHGETYAVFPTLAYDRAASLMISYAHMGQHGACAMGYYWDSRPATPDEYADLLRELRGIYESGDDAVKLAVCKRISPAMRRAARESVA